MPQSSDENRNSHVVALAASEDGTADLKGMLRRLLRRWRLVVVMTVLTGAITYGFIGLIPPKYTAQTHLVLDDHALRSLSGSDKLSHPRNLTNPMVETAAAIMRSRAIMTEVIEKLNEDVKVVLRPVDGDDGAAADLVTDLMRATKVARVGSSFILEISVKTHKPVLSSSVANGLAERFIARQALDLQTNAEAEIKWLKGQVAAQKQHLETLENRLEVYKRSQFQTFGTTAELIKQQVVELSKQRTSKRIDRLSAEVRRKLGLAFFRRDGPFAFLERHGSAHSSALRAERDNILRNLEKIDQTFGANHPSRKEIELQLNQINTNLEAFAFLLLENWSSNIDALFFEEASLGQQILSLEASLSKINEGMSGQRHLESEIQIVQEEYETFMQRLSAAIGQSRLPQSQAKIINRAETPTVASSPQVGMLSGLGASFGMTASLLYVVLVDVLSTGFRSAAALERRTGLRVLSVLPDTQLTRPVAVLPKTVGCGTSLLHERIRQLQTLLTHTPMCSQSILVTSSISGEGKTTTSLALAREFASQSLRTVILDLEPSNSALSDLLEPGATPVFDCLGDAAAVDRVSAASTTFGFDYVGFDSTSSHEERLRPSQTLEILQQLKKSYEIIIIDAPPVLQVSHVLFIAPIVDRIVFLVGWKQTSEKDVDSGLTALANINALPFGIVLTKSSDEMQTYGAWKY